MRHRERLQYLGIGAWNTLFGYSAWALLHYVLHDYLNYLVILVLSYPIAIANAYVCYRYIVFRSHRPMWEEIPRFSAVYLLTLAANLVVLPPLLHVLPLSVYVVQAFFTLLVVIASYLGHRRFSFRVPAAADPAVVAEGAHGSGIQRETGPEDPTTGGE
jgi:putative flippase GtrA